MADKARIIELQRQVKIAKRALTSAPAPASGGVAQNEKGPADVAGPLRDHDPVATSPAATLVCQQNTASGGSGATAATPVSEAGGISDEQKMCDFFGGSFMGYAPATKTVEATAILCKARDAYTIVIRNSHASGDSSADRRHSEGEIRSSAAEVMFEEFGALSFEHVDALIAALAKPASSPAGGDVREALGWLDGFNAFRAGPCAQDVRTAFISGWMHRAEQEADLSQSTGGRAGE